MDAAPPSVAGPAAARVSRRFRFVIADSRNRETSAKRRRAVADYIDTWPDASIVSEERCGCETVVIVAVRRALEIEVAELLIRECPHYVKGTFAAGLG